MPEELDFPNGSMVKNLPVMQEAQVQSLGQENPLKLTRLKDLDHIWHVVRERWVCVILISYWLLV